MLDAIRQFFARRMESRDPGAPGQPSPSGIELAACALLLELAHADGEFSEPERRHIQSAITRHFGLDDPAARDLIALAEAERARSIDHFQFTRLINQQYDLGQKMVLAEVMWGVILADGTIAEHEASLIRKLAHLLDLAPGYLAQARRSVSKDS